MNLLPKSDEDFAKTEYWNNFFRERGKKQFEWYGEYAELCGELHNYVKKDDLILVVGCGNSMLSSDLFDVGCRNVTSIDTSLVAVKQMRNKVGKARPEMIFEQMDALNMTYERERFSVVLDKGTLDALMPKDTATDRERAARLFSEVDRVLKANGRYVIVSLLQNHILSEILDYFSKTGWMLRVTRCWDVEKRKIQETGCLAMPVFMVVCVKLRVRCIQSVLEVNVLANGKSVRLASKDEVARMIDQVQNTILQFREAKGETKVELCRIEEQESRYSICVVDSSRDQRRLSSYAAFIVPHGRESEWMFGTEEGRRHLRDSSGFDRLAVVTFRRNQDYGTMDEIQDELRQALLLLAPCLASASEGSPKVPYLTLGDGLGRRKTIFSATSQLSGEMIVEEVDVENETFRRLVFMSNQAVVQSEVKMKKGAGTEAVDWSHVGSGHIAYMSIGAAAKAADGGAPSVAVVGLGGGGLCVFLHKLFPAATVTAVEIDPVVAKIAGEYFGFQTNQRLKLVVEDGVDFLKKREKYDVIMFDVDSKEKSSPLSCPPPQFVEESVLEAVADALGEGGIFVTNVVSRVNAVHEQLLGKIGKHFSSISWYDLKEDVNRIVFASNSRGSGEGEWERRIAKAAELLVDTARERLETDDELLDVCHLMNALKV